MSTYPNGIPSSGFLSNDITDPALSFTPEKVTPNLIDNHSPVNRRTMVNSHGFVISQIANFVNSTYLGRADLPVLSGFITNINNENLFTEYIDVIDPADITERVAIRPDYISVTDLSIGSNDTTAVIMEDDKISYLDNDVTGGTGLSKTIHDINGIYQDTQIVDNPFKITAHYDLSLESQKWGYFYAKDSMSLASSGTINLTTFEPGGTKGINLDARTTDNVITAYADGDIEINSANGQVKLYGDLWSNGVMDLSSSTQSNIIQSNIMQMTGNRVHIGTNSSSAVYISGTLYPEILNLDTTTITSGNFDKLTCNTLYVNGEYDSGDSEWDHIQLSSAGGGPSARTVNITTEKFETIAYTSNTYDVSFGNAFLDLHANTVRANTGPIYLNHTGSLIASGAPIHLGNGYGAPVYLQPAAPVYIRPQSNTSIYMNTQTAPIYINAANAPTYIQGYSLQVAVTDDIALQNTTNGTSVVLPENDDIVLLNAFEIVAAGHLRAGTSFRDIGAYNQTWRDVYCTQVGLEDNSVLGDPQYAKIEFQSDNDIIISNRSLLAEPDANITVDTDGYFRLDADNGFDANIKGNWDVDITNGTLDMYASSSSQSRIRSYGNMELKSDNGQCDITGYSSSYYTSLNGSIGIQAQNGNVDISTTAAGMDITLSTLNDIVLDATGEVIIDAEDNIILDTSSNANAFITLKSYGADAGAVADVDDQDIGITAGRDLILHANTGQIKMNNLPTSAPATTGSLWVDTSAGNVLKVVV